MKDILIYFTSPMVLFAVLLVLVMLYFIINRPKEDKPDDSEKVAITTRDMLQDINKERRERAFMRFLHIMRQQGLIQENWHGWTSHLPVCRTFSGS